jgi:tetratricopeptide (TPR) repeat protein
MQIFSRHNLVRVFVLMSLSLGMSFPGMAQNIQATPEFQQAQQLVAQGNYDGAISTLQNLVTDSSYGQAAKIEIGQIRKRQADGELAAAMTHYNEAADNIYDGVTGGGTKGNETAKLLYELGQILQEKVNNPAKAASVYEKIIEHHPNFLSIDKVTFHLGTCYEKIGKHKEALQNYKEITDKYAYSPFFKMAQQKLKQIAPNVGQVADAIEVQESLVENAKGDTQAAKASMELAAMYLKSGDTQKAIQEYRRIAAEAPTPEIARQALQKAASLMDEKEKDYAGAASALEEMVSKSPNDPANTEAYFKLGRIYEENMNSLKTRVRGDQVLYKQDDENIKKAIEYYNMITESNPDADVSADAYLRKGKLYEERLKDPEEARTQYQEFLKRYPDHTKAESIREKLKALENN